jgi:hypothetical protein
MSFGDATMTFWSSMTAGCSQFRISSECDVEMIVSGPSKYTFLKLDPKQTQIVNALAKKVGIEYEKGPKSNTFMVYNGTFLPGRVKVEDSSYKASSEEKEIFGQIFDIASTSIAKQLSWSLNPEDVTKIVLEKTVDFSFIEANRACRLSIQLSQSAADRLGMDKDSRFLEPSRGNEKEVAMIIYPGQK